MSETKKIKREIDSLQGQIDRDRERINQIEQYLAGLGPTLHRVIQTVHGLLGEGGSDEEGKGESGVILPPGAH